GGEEGVAGQVHDVTQLTPAQPGPEGRDPAELVVGRHPRPGQGGATLVEQLQPDAPALLEGQRGRDVRLGTADGVPGPILGQVEAAREQGLAVAADVGQEDAHLTVLDLAQAAAPLAGDAARRGPLLGETRAIDDENGVGVADLLLDVAPQLGQDVVVTPAAGADEQLEGPAVEGGGGGDGVGGLALEGGELAAEEDQGGRPPLGAGGGGAVAPGG